MKAENPSACVMVNYKLWKSTITSYLNIVTCYATEDTFRIVNSFVTIPITRNYIHSQLFLTLCHIYTAYNHTRS
jgi:hypothetical protein